MLRHGEPNPLAIFGMRRIDHCPPHFVSVFFDIYVNEKTITDWIYTNLSGRFYFSDYFVEHEGSVSMRKCAAFEIAGEASYFSLFLDRINQMDYDY